MTPFLLFFSGGCHVMDNDVALCNLVSILIGVPLGAISIIAKTFLYECMLKTLIFKFHLGPHYFERE